MKSLLASFFVVLGFSAFAVRPVPSPALKARLADRSLEVIGIVHWGPNTFTDREWGYGDEDPKCIDPDAFDARQIAAAAKAGGLGGLVVVAKHHDGFCLWPTKTTEHNISKSPFRGGKGDYVKEMSDACRAEGIKFGVYCSPWDRNNKDYATAKYLKTYRAQLDELLGGAYGEVFEMWFDNANGGTGYYGGARESRTIPIDYYDYPGLFKLVRKYQPKVSVFNEDDSADFRWPGNEVGYVDPVSRATVRSYDPAKYTTYCNLGDKDGTTFHPCEGDFPLRRGWFYHDSEKGTAKSGAYLMQRYLYTVGSGATMDIGLAPDKHGRLCDEDVAVLKDFKRIRDAFFAKAAGEAEAFNVVVLTEDLSAGEQVDAWEIVADGEKVAGGGPIGLKRIKVLEKPVTARDVKFNIVAADENVKAIAVTRYYVDPKLVAEVMSATAPSGETETAKWMTAAADAHKPKLNDAPAELRVSHQVEPFDVVAPTFSWTMASDRAGARQTAYRLRVGDWDSGEVAGDQAFAIPYGGAALGEGVRVNWSVALRNEQGAWSEPVSAAFTTGRAMPEAAKWIANPVRPKDGWYRSTSLFTKTFRNAKSVRRAVWTVTSGGVFESFVNGRAFAADAFLKPGFTHWAKTRHSFTRDVTDSLDCAADATNVLSAQVSTGWWRDCIVASKPGHDRTILRASLRLEYADGTVATIDTDESWRVKEGGRVLFASIYDGEDYDARVSEAWIADGADTTFAAAEIVTNITAAVRPMEGPTVTLREDLVRAPVEAYVWRGSDDSCTESRGTAKIRRRFKSGETIELTGRESLVLDFGQNAAYVPRFTATAAAGVQLTMYTAEMLNDGAGETARGCDGLGGTTYHANYREARSQVHYTFAGTDAETYMPRYSFFGYRYLTVTATGPVKITAFVSVPVTSIHKSSECGELHVGDKDVEKLISNVRWGQYSNYLSVPTDCPQRDERLGWSADTQVFTAAGARNADTYAFLAKYLGDLCDTAAPNGSFTGVAPVSRWGDCGTERVGWSDAGIIIPYVMWRRTGDISMARAHWDALAKYADLLSATKFDSPTARKYQYADWLSYERCPDQLAMWRFLCGAYWLWDMRMMSALATALGKTEDAAKYTAESARARGYLKSEFFTANDRLKSVYDGLQTPLLFALKLGLYDTPEAKAKAVEDLRAAFAAKGDVLQTGFLGTSVLMETLSEVGLSDLAYTLLLNHQNPSWLYSVDQGATTIWERWNSYTKKDGFGPVGMNSFNHYAYGAVLEWMYARMAGIREDAATPGFRTFVLAPVPDRRLGSVSACYRSAAGEIRSAWSYDDQGVWTWTFTVPANTTARVVLPDGTTETCAAGTYVRRLKLSTPSVVRAEPPQDAGSVQERIDAAAKRGGGKVILEAGEYPSGTVYLRSNVELHLKKGAVLKGSGNWSDYDDVDDPRIGKTPERSKKAFLVAIGCTNVVLSGEGVVDGQGLSFYDTNVPEGRMFAKPPHPRTRMVELVACRDVRVEGLTFKDSPGWTFWIRNCENVTCTDLVIHGDQRMINNDGLHFDGCRHVRVSGCDIRTGDDCVIMRANRLPGGTSVCEDFVVENCRLDSNCQAIRLGCPSDDTIRNAVFRNLTITGGNGICSIHPNRYLQPGCEGYCQMENLLVEDCSVDVRGAAILYTVDPGIRLRRFGGTTFRNLKLRRDSKVVLNGTADSPLVDVVFESASDTAGSVPFVRQPSDSWEAD